MDGFKMALMTVKLERIICHTIHRKYGTFLLILKLNGIGAEFCNIRDTSHVETKQETAPSVNKNAPPWPDNSHQSTAKNRKRMKIIRLLFMGADYTDLD